MSSQNPFKPEYPEYDPWSGTWVSRNNGGGAIILLFLLIPLLFMSSIFVAVIFPVAGCGALVIGYVTETVLGWFVDYGRTDDAIRGWTTADLGRLTVMILASVVALFCLLPLEGWVSRRSFLYVQARHWIRVIGLPLMINEVGLGLFQDYLPQSWSTGHDSLAYGVTAAKLMRIAILAVCVHVVFRLIDTRGTGLSLMQRLGPPTRRATRR